jgi:hypothetical protein
MLLLLLVALSKLADARQLFTAALCFHRCVPPMSMFPALKLCHAQLAILEQSAKALSETIIIAGS